MTPTDLATGVCATVDLDLWFSDSRRDTAQAIKVCGTCPIQAACLAGAIERAEDYGVWGGITVTELRHRVRAAHGTKPGGRPRQPISHGTDGGYRVHRRRREPLCDPCRRAHRVAEGARDRRRKEAAA